MEWFPSARGRLFHQVDVRFPEHQPGGGFGLAPDAPQHCPHAREQFLGAERFHQVIIGPRVQALDAVLDLPLGGEHEDRHWIREAAQFRAHGVAIEFGHHDVEQDEVRLLFNGAVQPEFAIGRRQHPVALSGQHVLEGRAHGQFVFNNQYTFHTVMSKVLLPELARSFRFQISDFRFQTSDFRLRHSFGFRFSDFGFQIPDFRFHSDFGFRFSDFTPRCRQQGQFNRKPASLPRRAAD